MSTEVNQPGGEKPIEDLRIRFWGVQGSCPMFPEPHEVEEYRWMVAQDALQRVLRDLRQKGSDGGAGAVERLLAITDDRAALMTYLRTLGASELPVYGGETTCVSIETAEGNVLMLDGGSGIRNGSKRLIDNWGNRERTLYLLASHGHLDHRSGLPFSQFCFVRPPFDIKIYGTRSFLGALDQGYGVLSRQITQHMYYDDPIDYRIMSASFEGIEIPSSEEPADDVLSHPWRVHEFDEPIKIGSTTITPFDVYHGPTRCLAYKIQHGGKTFIFCTDHELRHGTDPLDPRQQKSMAAEARLIEHCQDADLGYFDGQYFLEEYYGRRRIGLTAAVPRMDWGHGCIEDVMARSHACRIKHTLIGHHDPERTWQDRIRIDGELAMETAKGGCRIELAKSDLVMDL
jgi:phosphoribosyl 1,2-cyclic phosphodiesterase